MLFDCAIVILRINEDSESKFSTYSIPPMRKLWSKHWWNHTASTPSLRLPVSSVLCVNFIHITNVNIKDNFWVIWLNVSLDALHIHTKSERNRYINWYARCSYMATIIMCFQLILFGRRQNVGKVPIRYLSKLQHFSSN